MESFNDDWTKEERQHNWSISPRNTILQIVLCRALINSLSLSTNYHYDHRTHCTLHPPSVACTSIHHPSTSQGDHSQHSLPLSHLIKNQLLHVSIHLLCSSRDAVGEGAFAPPLVGNQSPARGMCCAQCPSTRSLSAAAVAALAHCSPVSYIVSPVGIGLCSSSAPVTFGGINISSRGQ